jgi:hypothetical protein
MKYLLISAALFIFAFKLQSQELQVTLETAKTEYSQKKLWQDDSIVVTYKIKNTGNDTILLKLAGSYSIVYISDEDYHSSHCWKIYPHQTEPNTDGFAESFKLINPGEEYINTEALDIGWVCRNAWPMGKKKFVITYNRVITAADNFYLYGNRNSRKTNRVFINAWEGTLKSNSIEITIKD